MTVNDHQESSEDFRQLVPTGMSGPPMLFVDAGEKAWWRCLEFFAAHIRNVNTRLAYARAISQFSVWCHDRRVMLHQVSPFHVAAYIEDLGRRTSRPTVKQHLAAIRMLMDFLVVGQVMPSNPASSVRGPKHVVKRGKTPVLTAQDARQLFDSIDITTIGGLRDRALMSQFAISKALLPLQ